MRFSLPQRMPDIGLPLFLLLLLAAGLIMVLYTMTIALRVRKTHNRPLFHTLLWFLPECLLWLFMNWAGLFKPEAFRWGLFT
jgi:hypothetical protein